MTSRMNMAACTARCTTVLATVLALMTWNLAWDLTGTAWAQDEAGPKGISVTVGLFAPTTPLGGPGQQVEFVNNLAAHLGSATGNRVSGRVYSSARAFTSAVKKGAIQFAVVDAPYAAARRLPYRILAAATKGGNATVPWQLVASGGVSSLADLKKKTVAVPKVGVKVPNFVSNVLLDGEVEPSYFRKITSAPNPSAAATMVSLQRVDAAFVPTGTSLPGPVSRVLTLRSVGLPMFVALKSAKQETIDAFARAIFSFSSSGAISGFTTADSGNYNRLRRSFGKSKHKAIMAVPKPARLSVSDILANRKFEIQPSDIKALIVVPVTSAKPPSDDKPAPAPEKADKSEKSTSEAKKKATPSGRKSDEVGRKPKKSE